MADWLASDQTLFPYLNDLDGINGGTARHSQKKAAEALEDLNLLHWTATQEWKKIDLYQERFGRFDRKMLARPVQTAAVDVAKQVEEPGLAIIEAPMGEGKTEAALAMAEIFAQKSGRGGLFFALPTQATSDGIFPRIKAWVGKIACAQGGYYSLSLAHGKARLNEEYRGLKSSPQGIEDEEGGVVARAWFTGRKKSLLADFVVGTVDQVLMAGIMQKHQAMRHLALANKVVVIDECHAYDAYMSQYLKKVLNWLGTYRVPVILLSATLPAGKRRELVDYYNDEPEEKETSVPWETSPELPGEPTKMPPWALNKTYPLITYTDNGKVMQKECAPSGRRVEVSLAWLCEDAENVQRKYELPIIGEIIAKLDEYLSDGGCAGIIVNTVKRAQAVAKALTDRYGEGTVSLLHSRFIAAHRVAKELEIRELLGPPPENSSIENKRPDKLIVVGTQVMEQSLDVDFDLLFTDICPMDLLLQRIGRLHRHERQRPKKLQKAICFIVGTLKEGFESGAEKIYGKYLLLNTRQLLLSKQILNIPADIPVLVDAAYDPSDLAVPASLEKEYAAAQLQQENKVKEKRQKAKIFQIFKPGKNKNLGTLIDWLNFDIDKGDATGKRAEATVRDTDDYLEVVALQKCRDGKLRLLPGLKKYGGRELEHDRLPEDELAAALAACTVNLPRVFSHYRIIDDIIDELEERNIKEDLAEWQESPWLKGELFLLLDENLSAQLKGYTLKYDEKYGLWSEKAGRENG
jgi:CRISPR-associated endonuclease/helicase Cas3